MTNNEHNIVIASQIAQLRRLQFDIAECSKDYNISILPTWKGQLIADMIDKLSSQLKREEHA